MLQSDQGIVEMMTGISELGFLVVVGMFLVVVVMPLMNYFSKKYRGYSA